MKRFYIGSIGKNSGKQVITLGLGLCIRERGLSLAYIKPVGREPVYHEGKLIDADALAFHSALGLSEPLKKTSPLVYSIDVMRKALSGKLKNQGQKIVRDISSLKADVVLIAGTTDIFEGSLIGINGLKISKMERTKAILVERYQTEETLDDILAGRELLGRTLCGVIINRVPGESMNEVKKEVVPYLEKKKVKVFGVVPEEKKLSAVTVKTLADTLGARVVCGEELLGGLVENFSIGAMDVTNALKFFRRTPNKAVITGAHRADIQMAALETSTRCIILTGGLLPNDVIIGKAIEKSVPILSVKEDTFATVDRIEALLGKAKVRDPERLPLIKALVNRHVDIDKLLVG
ncbi:MAG: phosphotransacetylase family protein [Nitrospirae bacterium]|nr:MAG: phosphotransacetylase family protein [Nitrospirota bacterium]